MPEKYEHLQYAVEKDGLCTITFNRPELMNAFSWPMMEELREALRRAEKDTAARVIILRGAGRCFSVGYDFRETPPDVIRPGVGPSDGSHDPRGVPDYGRGIWNSRAHVQGHVEYATVLLMRRFDVDELLALAEKERATYLFLAPSPMYAIIESPRLAERDHSSVRFWMYGGAPMPQEIFLKAAARLPQVRFIQGYGRPRRDSSRSCGPKTTRSARAPPAAPARSPACAS